MLEDHTSIHIDLQSKEGSSKVLCTLLGSLQTGSTSSSCINIQYESMAEYLFVDYLFVAVLAAPNVRSSHPLMKLKIPSATNPDPDGYPDLLTIRMDPDSPDVGQNLLAISVAHTVPKQLRV